MEHALRHPYLRVSGPGGVTYGGSQRRGRAAHMRRWGCGVIAAADLMLYLSLHRPGCRGTLFAGAPPAEEIDLDWYNDRADRLRRRWLPVIPWHGINGLALAFGVSVCLRRQGIPLHARWGVRPGRLWARIDRLLDADIPVVLSIGGGFPCFWKKDRLPLYPAPEKCAPAARTSAHYVIVTGADENWLRISSWGRCYYINKAEYCLYTERCSAGLLCNILDIRGQGL